MCCPSAATPTGSPIPTRKRPGGVARPYRRPRRRLPKPGRPGQHRGERWRWHRCQASGTERLHRHQRRRPRIGRDPGQVLPRSSNMEGRRGLRGHRLLIPPLLNDSQRDLGAGRRRRRRCWWWLLVKGGQPTTLADARIPAPGTHASPASGGSRRSVHPRAALGRRSSSPALRPRLPVRECPLTRDKDGVRLVAATRRVWPSATCLLRSPCGRRSRHGRDRPGARRGGRT